MGVDIIGTSLSGDLKLAGNVCRPAALNAVGLKDFIGIRRQAMGRDVRMDDGSPTRYDV